VDMSESSHHARLYANILKVPVEVSIQGGARLHHVGHDSYARGSRSPCSDVGFGGHVQCSVCQTFHIVVGSMESGQLNAFHISFLSAAAHRHLREEALSHFNLENQSYSGAFHILKASILTCIESKVTRLEIMVQHMTTGIFVRKHPIGLRHFA
jgi:hypothetical protein